MSHERRGCPSCGTWFDTIPRLTQALAEAEAALEFYASTHTWRTATVFACGHHEDSKADRDGGERARQALSPNNPAGQAMEGDHG